MNDTRNESLVDTTRNEDIFEHESGANSTVQDGMGLPTRIDEVRYQIEWERRLLQQERELVKRERELLERESRMGTNSQNQHVHYHNNAQQVIPEFDPGKTNSFIATQWIKTVENLANIFKWDSNTLLFNAIAKLSGAAKMWFEGTQGQIYDWDTFKRQIILDFPTAIDDADIHFELSKRKKKTDESYENYIYCMKAIASKGNLSEKAILKYIIAGINDKDLARLLALSGPLDVRDLLSKLKSYENTINMQVKPTVSTATTSSFRAQDKTTNIKCYNCNEFGHISIKCPRQQRKVRCFKCEKTGHMAKECPTNKSRAVNRISEVDPLTDPYHKKIKLNDKETFAFVDLGSDVVTLRKKDAAILGCKYEPCSVILKGFGGERYPVLGKGTYTIEIDGIEFKTEVCVVPDQCQDDAIIIGRNMLDEPDIRITKEGSVLKIERIKEKQTSNPKNENWDDTEMEDEQIQENNQDADDNTEDDARAEEWIHGEENRNEIVLDIDYKVNEKITEEGLTLNLRKCCFLMEEVEYLGMEVNGDGIRPGPRKIDAVRNFKCPENVHEIRQFLGLSGYFRKFVKNYSIIAKPLTLLTRKDQKWIWSEEQQQAFQTIRDDLVNRPILTLYDPNAIHEVHTDASKVGLAGILLQKSANEPLRPVAYFSRQTSDLESQYHSFELECLAVLETVERFRIYLLGRKFTVVTDCNSLKTMMKKRELTPRVARWILRLQEFDFDVEHRAGSKMAHVDALSRQPNETHQEVETASLNVFAVRIHEDDWLVTMQLQDPKLTDIRQILQQRPKDNNEKQIHHDYKLEKNRLYRKVNGETKWVVPKAIKWRVIKGCHDDMGHYGIEKTLQHVKRHYWFPRMRKRVKGYIDSCIECAYHKRKTGKAEAELHNIERIPIPFDTANSDHLEPAELMKLWYEPYDPGGIGDDSTDSEAECEEKGNGNE